MRQVFLSEITARLESGSRPAGGATSVDGIPSLGGEHLSDDGGFRLEKLKYVPADFYENLRAGKIERDDILIVKDGATTGRVCFVDENFPLDAAAVNEHVFRLAIDESRAVPKYVFYFLHSGIGKKLLLSDFRGATVGGISRGFINLAKVPLPSLDEQRRIVSILDRGDALRHRCDIIASDYAKLQSALVENVSSTATANTRLGDLAEVSSGITKGRKTAEATRELPYLAVSNVQAGYLDMTLVKTIAATQKEIERYALRAGDVLMTEGGDPDKLGRGTVWRDELPLCLHQNHVFKVRVNDTNVLHPEFLGAYLGSRAAKDYFLRSAKQTTGIATINMTQLKNLPVPDLSNSDQLQFISQLDAIREQQKHNRIFAARLDSLFMALQSNAFSGRL